MSVVFIHTQTYKLSFLFEMTIKLAPVFNSIDVCICGISHLQLTKLTNFGHIIIKNFIDFMLKTSINQISFLFLNIEEMNCSGEENYTINFV